MVFPNVKFINFFKAKVIKSIAKGLSIDIIEVKNILRISFKVFLAKTFQKLLFGEHLEALIKSMQ